MVNFWVIVMCPLFELSFDKYDDLLLFFDYAGFGLGLCLGHFYIDGPLKSWGLQQAVMVSVLYLTN